MEFSKFVEWFFYSMMSGIGVYLVRVVSQVKESIEKLNTTVAVEIQKNNSLKEDFCELREVSKEHEKRIAVLEQKSFNCKVTN